MPLSSTAEATDKGAAVVDLNGALGYLLEGCRLIGRSVTQNSRYRLWAVHRRDSCEHECHNESGLVDPVERGLAELIRSREGFHNHPAPTRPTRKHNGRRQNPSTREEAMSCGYAKSIYRHWACQEIAQRLVIGPKKEEAGSHEKSRPLTFLDTGY